jgi:hypothetical protein
VTASNGRLKPSGLMAPEWPDGTIEQINTFKAHFEALNWVNNLSEAWLQERKG